MRAFLSQTLATTRPAADAAWLPGLPHVVAALAAWPVLGGVACATGLLLGGLVTFVVWLPLTVLTLNQGAPLAEDAAGPALTPNARRALFALWTGTVWLAAAVTG